MARVLSIFCAILFLNGCGEAVDRSPQPVVAERYDAFWLWAGVKPQPVLAQAKSIYILAGEVRADDPGRFRLLRPVTPVAPHAQLWLVVRVETLDWTPQVQGDILNLAEKWNRQGRPLAGVQIDFDSHTRNLKNYAAFLRTFRKDLPSRYQLSITGLLDWSANGDPSALSDLADIVDEIVLQTYQGRETIPGYERWLAKLDDLPMPFRVGLIQGGRWHEPENLNKIPNFRGFVIFLVNSPSRQAPD